MTLKIPFLLLAVGCLAAQAQFSPTTQPFVSVDAPVVALTHVRVIDGTGSAPVADQTVVIAGGKIQSIGGAVPDGARVMDLTGHTVIPGLIGMHQHLFYPSGGGVPIYNEHAFSFPRLYLACGITTMRTAGSLEPYTDLNLKALIDAGRMPGPKMLVTGPYLEGAGAFTPQMHELKDAEDARRTVEYWVAEGVTSFKAYMHITRAELAAAIKAAHEHGVKVTGHLCSIGFREAAELGIDNLEHGLVVDTEFMAGKKPDQCPAQVQTLAAFRNLDVSGAAVQDTIRELVRRGVAITSTLSVFEAISSDRPPLGQRVLDAMTHEAAVSYLSSRARGATTERLGLLRKEMEFERAFVKAGGLLIAGADPTGNGGALAGFGDQRNLELLVEAGFTPVEAIQIYTSNAARFLGDAGIGVIAAGKQADLVVIHGDPSVTIEDVEKVTIVFKDGVGYDSAKLIESARGAVGLH
ncbi:MAG: amidohydrolase family protein [Acidobacteriota bacterium]|nr:amidohydrolase family protein [Acidobacteriota bacterium]